jgi:hypothetical protein
LNGLSEKLPVSGFRNPILQSIRPSQWLSLSMAAMLFAFSHAQGVKEQVPIIFSLKKKAGLAYVV